MSENIDIPTPTMPSKIHYTAHADAHGVSRMFGEQLTEAAGVLDKYVIDGDPGRPHMEHHVESLAQAAIDRGAKRGFDEILWRAKELLKERCTNKDTMYPAVPKDTKSGSTFYPAQHVYLDLDNVADHIGRNWALPVPSILFASLDPERDRLWKASEYDAEGNAIGGCVGIAVYFDPEDRDEDREIVWNKRVTTTASDWDPQPYQGVVRTFATFTEMRQARKDLIAAVKTIQTPPESDEEPDILHDEEYLESLDDEVPFDGI